MQNWTCPALNHLRRSGNGASVILNLTLLEYVGGLLYKLSIRSVALWVDASFFQQRDKSTPILTL